ncbi:MAG: NAD(+)/NADH kinase [Chloroflexi bacterium]|nr:NAD(+)/NADH kinase [Chloroflexota bacterium]
MTTIGILYHPQLAAAAELARAVAAALSERGAQVWMTPTWQDGAEVREQVSRADVLVGLGGDGTILHAAKMALPRIVPVLGVNFGRLGFLAELQPEEAAARIPELLAGHGRIEERAMVEVSIHRPEVAVTENGQERLTPPEGPLTALNDIVVARYAGRPVYIEVTVDGHLLNIYRCDGVIVSTATGSTGYNLSAGGPILHPESQNLVLTPVAPHLSLSNSLVLAPGSVVDLRVHTDHLALLSVDGQLDVPLQEGDHLIVRRSPHVARFLRVGPPGLFFQHLMDRLR